MRTIRWYARADHFDWLGSYLEQRGITGSIRLVMGTIALSLGLMPIEAMLVVADRRGWPIMGMYWLCGLAGVVVGYLWLTRWPTRRQSLIFAFLGSGTMAFWALAQTDPALSLIACSSLAISGAYFALFHSPPYAVYNAMLAGTVGLQAAWRLWVSDNPVHAVLAFWLVLTLNVVSPLAVQTLISSFGVDLPHADRDSLTGLLNRRRLRTHLTTCVAAASPTDYLRVSVIDLDDFKRLNDTHGHCAGDTVLTGVAQILRDNAFPATTTCRMGGEEFLIFDTSTSAEPPAYTEPIRQQIASLPKRPTASIGTARLQLRNFDPNQFNRLIAVADRAMYEAKRRGGNLIRHTPPMTSLDEADQKHA